MSTITPDMLRLSPNNSTRAGHGIEYIILHHTAGKVDTADMHWLCDSVSEVSAHYLIYRNGLLYRLVPDDRAAWHAGECPGFPNLNQRSIGIELCHDGTPTKPFTEAQYARLIPLLVQLVRRYTIPSSKLLGHRDVAPKRKVDPADSFDWARVRRAVYGS